MKQDLPWTDLQDLLIKGVCLIDTRSEGEFVKAHIPLAINIPLFNNEERHEIGLTYKTVGSKIAIALGVEIFAKKSENFLDECIKTIAANTVKNTVVVYCWRGGMRSHFVAKLLEAVGFEVYVIAKGYKGYRRQVLELLHQFSCHDLLVLNGKTGSGKTEVVEQLIKDGYPVVDFEGIACHRGSAFGSMAQVKASPSQQQFENELAHAYFPIKNAPRILVEIESVIGPVSVPLDLKKNVYQAPMIYLERDFSERVDAIVSSYFCNWDEAAKTIFLTGLEMLFKYLSLSERQAIREQLEIKDFHAVVAALLNLRYDKSYEKSLKRHESQKICELNLSNGMSETLKEIIKHFIQKN